MSPNRGGSDAPLRRRTARHAGAASVSATVSEVTHRDDASRLRGEAADRAQRGDWRGACADLETAMTLAPLPTSAALLLVQSYTRIGWLASADAACEQLLQAGPHAPAVYAGLYAESKRCGRLDRALEVCRSAVEADPEDHAAHFAMAHVMVGLGYAATYVAGVLENATRIAPKNEVYRISAAIQLVRCGRLEEAYEHLEAASVSRLVSLTCRCSVERLLALCVWAGDQPRSSALGAAFRELSTGAAG